jgi:catalase
MDIDSNPANYEPNSINDNWPRETPPGPKRGGFESYQARVEGHKIRERSPSFGEYYSHPRLFWQSQTPVEQQHIIGAFSFELSKVARPYIRERVLDHLTHIDISLAQGVAENLGIELSDEQMHVAPPKDVNGLKKDPSLSLYAVPSGNIKGRVVAVLLSENASATDVLAVVKGLKAQGVHAKLLFSRMGQITADDGSVVPISATFAGSPSVSVDAVIVPGGDLSSILNDGQAAYYLLEAYKHLKVIGLAGNARKFKAKLHIDDQGEEGIVEADDASGNFIDEFLKLLAGHRIWTRSNKVAHIPA